MFAIIFTPNYEHYGSKVKELQTKKKGKMANRRRQQNSPKKSKQGGMSFWKVIFQYYEFCKNHEEMFITLVINVLSLKCGQYKMAFFNSAASRHLLIFYFDNSENCYKIHLNPLDKPQVKRNL